MDVLVGVAMLGVLLGGVVGFHLGVHSMRDRVNDEVVRSIAEYRTRGGKKPNGASDDGPRAA